MGDKITIRWQENDIDDDGEILSAGPIMLKGVVNTIEELEAIDTTDFNNDDNLSIVYYVKQVDLNGPDNLRYRGAYFYYKLNPDGSNWQEIMLGTHSHFNKEILDQIASIDPETLNNKKILTIEKDGNNCLVGWSDPIKEFPEGADTEDVRYIMVSENGVVEWVNLYQVLKDNELILGEIPAPAQTFKMKQITITEMEEPHTVLIEDLHYDESIGDKILLFDGKYLVETSIIANEIFIDGVEYLKIINEDLDIGETLTVIVLRSGIDGILDSMRHQYVTFEDLQTAVNNYGGQFNLKNYISTTDIKNYSLKNHTHSGFSKIGHTHDGRYANYFHTHPEYMSKTDAEALILDTIGVEKTDDELIQHLVTNIKDYTDTKFENYDTSTTVDEKINNFNDKLNTDEILVTTANIPLTEYLNNLNNLITDETVIDDSDVEILSEITVIAKDGYIGSYKNGDVIPTGTKLSSVISNMLKDKIVPQLKEPELNAEILYENNEIGSISTITFTPQFIQNDAGALNYIELHQVGDTDIVVQTVTGSTPIIHDFTLTDEPIEIYLIANYQKGDVHTDNLVINGEEYFIDAGEIEKRYNLIGVRKMFYGSVPFTSDYNSDSIRDCTIRDIPKANDILNLKIINAEKIVFAFPENLDLELKSIFYIDQGIYVDDLFNSTTGDENILVAGNNDYPGEKYKIYYCELPQRVSVMNLRLNF